MSHSIMDRETLPLAAIPAAKGDISEKSAERPAMSWKKAGTEVLPIYLATHISFLVLTYLAALFSLGNFSSNTVPLHVLWQSWNRWDTSWYTRIAAQGYQHTVGGTWAFFPFLPMLERAFALIVQDPFIAGLIISNLATFGVFTVLYRLVAEDFHPDRAWRTVLYLAVFPTAFFFAAAYNEALFLFFALLSFYSMRRGRWWLMGLFALGASLTRSTAACLFVPFAYEYFRQRHFQWRKIDWHILSAIGIVAGTILFMIYGYFTAHDALAFEHVQAQGNWRHFLTFPGIALVKSVSVIRQNAPLSFPSIHNIMDLVPGLFILGALILSFIGPWKLQREHWAYPLYGLAIFLLVIMVPEQGLVPIASLARYMLEAFPAFVVLAAMGEKRHFNVYYLCICLPLLAFWLLQWLTGGWMV